MSEFMYFILWIFLSFFSTIITVVAGAAIKQKKPEEKLMRSGIFPALCSVTLIFIVLAMVALARS